MSAVLLTAADRTVAGRLQRREIGSGLAQEIQRSRRAAVELEELVPGWVHRISTDDRRVAQIAQQIQDVIGWHPLPEDL